MKVARVHSGFAPRGVLPAAGTSVPAGTTINSTVEYTLVLVLLTARRLFFFFHSPPIIIPWQSPGVSVKSKLFLFAFKNL
jgi:hypothetical protein